MDALLSFFSALFTSIANGFAWVHGHLFEWAVQPLVYHIGLMQFHEEAFTATEWFLLGIIEVTVLYIILRPLEKLRPAEVWHDRRGVGVDVLYTLLHRLGGFALIAFFILTPVFDALEGWLRLQGFKRFELDNIWPGVTTIPLIGFLLYLVVLDFFDYWYHRIEHRVHWWWQLHAVHHSQTKMSLWADNRNHVLDDFMRDAFLATIALCIGAEPSQFVMLVIASRMVQSVQHANIRVSLGWLGERLIVSPTFHRVHHAIRTGHLPDKPGAAYGCNFGVLFPWWDMLFGTARFDVPIQATGIADQQQGRNYGQGFWQQQWLAFKRMFGRDGFAPH